VETASSGPEQYKDRATKLRRKFSHSSLIN
jgi:hypothetical protein